MSYALKVEGILIIYESWTNEQQLHKILKNDGYYMTVRVKVCDFY